MAWKKYYLRKILKQRVGFSITEVGTENRRNYEDLAILERKILLRDKAEERLRREDQKGDYHSEIHERAEVRRTQNSGYFRNIRRY